MKKICLLIVLMFISPLAWAGLNSNFDYMNIPTESFGNIYFRKSTLQEVKTKHPQFKSEKLPDGSTILSCKPKTGTYSEIRIGFTQNTLEWIEFILREKQRIDKILSRYGPATEVNYNYNKLYDYYNYEYFNFSVDKQQKFFYSVSIFANPKLPTEMANFDKELPGLNNLTKIQNFIPGRYIEEAFGDYYQSIYPKFNLDGSKTYTINNNITKKYKQAELIFRNGLLKFLVLHPENLNLSQIKSTYGDCVKKTTHNNQIFYDYGNFTVVTDMSNKVLKIAVD